MINQPTTFTRSFVRATVLCYLQGLGTFTFRWLHYGMRGRLTVNIITDQILMIVWYYYGQPLGP
jgi:hypothetical protein